MSVPKISVLLPIYNGGPYLAEQVETILAQSDPDLELLAIDDGSRDDSVALIDDVARRDPRVRRLSSEGNAGQIARLLELIDHARGEFVAIADQDDRWALDRNARLLAAIGDRQLAFGTSRLIDKDGVESGRSLLDVLYGAHQSAERLSSLVQPMFSAHAMLIRRSTLRAEPFRQALPFDWLIALDAMFGGGAVPVPEAVVYHRLHDSNQCNTVAATSRGRLSADDLRHALLFRTPARLALVDALDFLGRSPNVSAGWRRTFTTLARHVRTVWFSQWRALRPDQAELRDRIVSTLAPLAESPADLAMFARHIDVLTRPFASGSVIGEVRRRLRHAKAG